MIETQKLVIDETKIKKAILSGLPLTITTFTLPKETETYVEDVLSVFLKLSGQEKLRDYIAYCVRELVSNAKKANTKRVYFKDRNLDITDAKEYQTGMADFKEATLNNTAYYLQLQKEKGLYIRIIMQLKENIVSFEIRNNAAITRNELIRIHDRLVRSRKFNSLDEALSQVFDDSEGAGLGLVILALMLRKMGLDEECFEISSNNKETIARLKVPLEQIYFENITMLSEVITNNIDSLPCFPENILEIQRHINNPDIEMIEVSRLLSMDPVLTADLLRIVNSASYMLSKRVDNIFEAVKIVGINVIKNLLYSYGTQKVLGANSEEKKKLWQHSNKTAFYAYTLVKNFKSDKSLLDDIYVCGILHDMGKIVFSNVHPDMLEKIQKLCLEKNIPVSTFEDLSAGMNHAEIGALIAKKWNFPDNIVEAIRYHHNPSSVSIKYQDLVESVYLANMFCEYENGTVSYEQFDKKILECFDITSQMQFDNIIKSFGQQWLSKGNFWGD